MCVILDTNAAHEVFGSNTGQTTEAGEAFFAWLSRGKGTLVVGGQLGEELDRVPQFRMWASQAILAGQLVNIDDKRVKNKTQEIEKCGNCQSNDKHIIALAQVSGTRLLFSNDKNLHKDFKNADIINHPRGKIYSTMKSGSFTEDKRKLLKQHHCKPGN